MVPTHEVFHIGMWFILLLPGIMLDQNNNVSSTSTLV